MAEEKNDQDINYEEENNEIAAIDIKNKLEKLKEKLEQCQQEKQANLAGWQRAQADFINYRRRQEEQTAEWAKMFGAGLMKELLPVLDSMDASLAQLSVENNFNPSEPPFTRGADTDTPLTQRGDGGLKLLREQLMQVLAGHGLMEMKTVGEKFNPALHEAVECVAGRGEKEGLVVEEAQKGYLLNGKVIRTAKVKVTKNL